MSNNGEWLGRKQKLNSHEKSEFSLAPFSKGAKLNFLLFRTTLLERASPGSPESRAKRIWRQRHRRAMELKLMNQQDRPRKTLPPLQAIRAYCLWCGNGQPSEARFCSSEACPLHPYRMGVMPAVEKKSSLKAIRGRCLDCAGDSTKDVAECKTNCALNPFRFGRNPNYGQSKRTRARLQIRAVMKKSTDHEAIS